MARLPRFFIPGHPLHVILRGNNRQRVFATSGITRSTWVGFEMPLTLTGVPFMPMC